MQTATGLTVGDTYHVDDSAGSTVVSAFSCDSDGKATFTVTPDAWGQNKFTLENATATIITFYIDNQDIVPWITPVLQITIVLGLIGAIVRLLRF